MPKNIIFNIVREIISNEELIGKFEIYGATSTLLLTFVL